jgi:SAM-dependent methyltransferase
VAVFDKENREETTMGSTKTGNERFTDNIQEHYNIETKLADRLREATQEERLKLYSSVYDELFRAVPSIIARKSSEDNTTRAARSQLSLVRRYLNSDSVFLEVGPGDCALSFAVCDIVKEVYAVDVSTEITRSSEQPSNFNLVISDGLTMPVPAETIDVAFSHQMMEHLHPNDAWDQLQNICATLKPGGVYVCVTPNRLGGPYDISRYFDKVARGLHLKEYTATELVRLLKSAGFRHVDAFVFTRGYSIRLLRSMIVVYELLLGLLPSTLRRKMAWKSPWKILFQTMVVGHK